MDKLHIIDNNLKAETFVFTVAIPKPYNCIMVKDRTTKQWYVMVRTKDADPFNITKKQLFPVPYTQYDNIDIQIEEINNETLTN